MSEKHFPCGPSTLERRAACPGSLEAEAGLPDTAGEDAAEGTRLHGMVAGWLRSGVQGEFEIDADADGAAAVQFCIEYVRRQTVPPGLKPIIEQFVDLAWLHPLIGGGTVDFALVDPYGEGLVVDWKFGRGTIPPAPRSLQLRAYALGIARQYDLRRVQIDLVQAKLQHITSDVIDTSDLKLAAENLLRIAERTIGGPRIAGPHCKYCRALAGCLEAAYAVETATASKPVTASEIAAMMPKAALAQAWAGAIQQTAAALGLRK